MSASGSGSSSDEGSDTEYEVGALLALGRCRVVVSGPAPFNVAVAEMLEAQCEVDPTAITILAAQPGELQRARSSCGM